MKSKVTDIVRKLDNWVDSIPATSYVPNDWKIPEKYEIAENFAIQQNRDEIVSFIEALVKNNKFVRALEIGLGYYGSTHYLWRTLFKEVITIEKNSSRVREYGNRMANYYETWVLSDGMSKFIYGYSYEPSVVEAAYSCGGIDLLFIDGDHQYKSVLTDYLLYEPLVNSGGIIAFHDTAITNYEYNVQRLMKEISEGYFGKKINLIEIINSKSLGISYYVKD